MDSQCLCEISTHPRGFAGRRDVGARENSGQHDSVLFAGASRCRICRNTGIEEPVYVSPFVGRLDDQGEDGMDLVRNIKKMYEPSDGHVHVLAASIRTINHLLCSFLLGAELATVPSKVLQEWAAAGFPMPDHNFKYKPVDAKDKPLKPIPYKELDLNLGPPLTSHTNSQPKACRNLWLIIGAR
jgi:hypothetical protein